MKKYLILISTILIITSCDIEEGPFITDYNAYVNPEKKVLIEMLANPGKTFSRDEISKISFDPILLYVNVTGIL